MPEQYGPHSSSGGDMNASFVDTRLAVVAALLPTLATISVVLRFMARKKKGNGKYRADDWWIVVTLLMCWGHSINTLVAGATGGINTIKVSPLEYANIALRTLSLSLFFLIPALYTVKISLLCFYNHLFAVNERFKIAVKIMMAILTMWFISSLVCNILSTEPIESWDAQIAHHRYDFDAWYLSYSALSIFFDVAILCFPLPMVKQLRVSTKQKISIMGIFWLGAFVCVAATIRFVLLYNSIFKMGPLKLNQYSTITSAFIWAEAEPNVAVIAACLPTYGPFFADKKFGAGVMRSLRSMLGRRSTTGGSGGNSTGLSGGSNTSKTIGSDGSHELETSKSWAKYGMKDLESQRDSDEQPLKEEGGKF